MRNFPNPPSSESIESLVAHINAHRHDYGYVTRIGLEVERNGERRVLAPAYDSLGFAPRIGDEIECSGLGDGSHWRVVAVATGYPGQMQITR